MGTPPPAMLKDSGGKVSSMCDSDGREVHLQRALIQPFAYIEPCRGVLRAICLEILEEPEVLVLILGLVECVFDVMTGRPFSDVCVDL